MDNPNSSQEIQQPNKNNKVNLSIDTRVIILVLVLVIAGMLLVWKPWQDSAANDTSRTVSVTGDAKLNATPDEYFFSPNYQFKNQSKDAALAELTKKSDDITKKLKDMGIADNKIKSSSDGYNYYFDQSSGLSNYSLQLSVTVNDKALAQKVQDYLVSTAPTGAVSPQANFSDARRKALQSQARDQATKDARAKADQSASNLGFKLGKVKSVKDDAGFDSSVRIYNGVTSAGSADDKAKPSLAVQPGQNDLSYSVTVVYYLK